MFTFVSRCFGRLVFLRLVGWLLWLPSNFLNGRLSTTMFVPVVQCCQLLPRTILTIRTYLQWLQWAQRTGTEIRCPQNSCWVLLGILFRKCLSRNENWQSFCFSSLAVELQFHHSNYRFFLLSDLFTMNMSVHGASDPVTCRFPQTIRMVPLPGAGESPNLHFKHPLCLKSWRPTPVCIGKAQLVDSTTAVSDRSIPAKFMGCMVVLAGGPRKRQKIVNG